MGLSSSGHRSRGSRARVVLGGALSALTLVGVVWGGSAASASGQDVYAWGVNVYGAVGDGTDSGPQTCGTPAEACSTVPVSVRRLKSVTAISAGLSNLALLSTGTVMAWGYNYYGELGDGTHTGPQKCAGAPCSTLPVPVSGLSGVTAISAGIFHSLALLSTGKVMAWGYNGYGQLGNGTNTNSDVPVLVHHLKGATAIAAGGEHSLALLSNGTVVAWGENNRGQLGDNSTVNSNVPVAVSGLSGVIAIAAGDQHSLALLSDGTVMAWGSNKAGQLGDGFGHEVSTVPVPVSGLSGVTAIAAGSSHSLALLSDKTVMAWGANGNGQLGDGTTATAYVPVPVSGLSGVTAISAGFTNSLALLSDSTVMTWGYNDYGQLGNGTTTDSTVPVAVSGLSGVTKVSDGSYGGLALI